ncbi:MULTISPECIES: hypothetical protein [unclassified Bradyrhizobium]|uniref:hypothetical protein n=1 Tax=unclassified Bradyrhizobium TaxID=2631580 RepID=UPI002478EF2C|nr:MULTISPECIES: hypothetical protein [unclassified Bradyrhizobium]WGR73807.1 hypothetical protein MTX24_13775 [Bradyrhizobium sp. ISRA426]WGR78644.1 hypothetical protein MTX21_38745 [Bradyrhizobium sp. ISRA430]WGR89046.1 hypothetical protein MTX25_13790 [Bradyrhizobium sp. ISRA432]
MLWQPSTNHKLYAEFAAPVIAAAAALSDNRWIDVGHTWHQYPHTEAVFVFAEFLDHCGGQHQR